MVDRDYISQEYSDEIWPDEKIPTPTVGIVPKAGFSKNKKIPGRVRKNDFSREERDELRMEMEERM